jgi:tetratricopeptide (TPR) repeat protein
MHLPKLTLLLFAVVLTGSAGARKRYDERGNPLAQESKTQAAAGEENRTAADAMPQQATLDKAEPAALNAASATPEAANAEDEAAQRQVLNPLTKVYLENAQMYLRSARVDKALEFLRRSQEAGEDNYSREARLQSLYLRARRGDTGLATEAEGLDEAVKSAALLRAADGYDACAREAKQKPECLPEAERIYALLAELAPGTTDGKLAALRLAQLLLDQGRLEAALPHLTRLLADEQKSGSSVRAVPYDRAWFALASLYEKPWYHRDTHKARLAYLQVLRYPESPYHKQAKERIRWLERFGTGYSHTGAP